VFVGNIPLRLDHYGLKEIFMKAGYVCDTYIPIRRSRQGRFGFVRFRKEEEARKGIQLFHNAVVRGSKLYVTMANPRRKYQWKSDPDRQRRLGARTLENRKGWRKKGEVHERESARVQESQPFKMKVVGEVNQEFEE